MARYRDLEKSTGLWRFREYSIQQTLQSLHVDVHLETPKICLIALLWNVRSPLLVKPIAISANIMCLEFIPF